MTIISKQAVMRASRLAPWTLLFALAGSGVGCLIESEGEDDDDDVTCEHDGKRYEVGERFKIDCNTCTCSENGSAQCTAIGCGDAGRNDAGRDDAGRLPPCLFDGEKWVETADFPESDDCNGCGCDANGEVVCTLIACGEPPPKTCQFEGKTYREGDTFHDALRCNGCTCTAQGVACTARACDPAGACTIGDTQIAQGNSIVCEDGCNSCLCNDGSWSSTDAACAPLPKVSDCNGPFFSDVNIEVLYRKGDVLALELRSSSCATRSARSPYALCWDGSFAESFPVQTKLGLAGVGDDCVEDAPVQKVFDLSPLREAYQKGYQTQTGEISISLGRGASLSYTF